MSGEGLSKERLHAIITGRVQGVGFRFYVKHQADKLELTGCVRNLPEGQVEVIAEGLPKRIDQLLNYLWLGPSGAVVIDVIQNRNNAIGGYTDFRIDTQSGY
jgi:acylphosphatase